MLVFKCDRCGQEFSPDTPHYTITKVEIDVIHTLKSGVSYSEQSYEDTELCESCKDRLIKFLKGHRLESYEGIRRLNLPQGGCL